ncbi:oligosaccharide flippase family protein [Novosphingobium sp. FSY-8]|uniref:Oligosaccharide flippase family protein n=2 Tax=Novosphingobium ovatum TaxID=1908523 RepID=A0ABW9XFJ1_9SPHN|nr:oligosaccharide flippase family protein [Novosphingobium ovatum]
MSVRGAAIWAMGGQYLSFAIQFITSVIISRFFLAPAEVGLFSIALAAAMVVSVLQDFGLSRYISGLPVIDADAMARCSTVALVFSFVVAGMIAASAFPMAHAYGHADLAPILLIIAGSYVFVPFAVVPMALMGRKMSFHGHFAVNVGGALAQGVVALVLSWLGFKAFALAWATLANGVARGMIAQLLRPALPWPLRFDGVLPIVSTGSRLTTLYACGALGNRTPDMIVGKLLGLLSVGLYSRAASLSDQFRMLISGAIGSVFFPAFARKRDAGEPLGPPYLRVVAGYTAVIWPGMAGLALAAQPVVHLLYGDKWMEVAPLLATISLTEIFLVMLPLHTDLPILLGRLNKLMVFNVIDTVMSLSLLAVGCLWFGTLGAAGSRVVYGVFWVALYARFLQGLVGFDVRALLITYAKSGIATLAALAPLAAVYALWMGPRVITLPVLIPAVGAGIGLWLVTLVLIRHPALDDLFGLITHLPGGHRLRPLHQAITAR